MPTLTPSEVEAAAAVAQHRYVTVHRDDVRHAVQRSDRNASQQSA